MRTPTVFQNLVTYVAEFNQRLSSAFELVRNTAGVQHERQKEYYDRKATNDSYAIDDLVWVLSKNPSELTYYREHHTAS